MRIYRGRQIILKKADPTIRRCVDLWTSFCRRILLDKVSRRQFVDTIYVDKQIGGHENVTKFSVDTVSTTTFSSSCLPPHIHIHHHNIHQHGIHHHFLLLASSTSVSISTTTVSTATASTTTSSSSRLPPPYQHPPP